MAKVKKAVPAKRETKGKQHAARAASFGKIAAQIRKRAYGFRGESALACYAIAHCIENEAKRLRTILR